MTDEPDHSPRVDVTVSIVNHENRDGVIACLESLEADTGRRASVQVIVLDNASEDGSASSIHDAFPSVEIIERSRRDGFGANHNLALGHATGRYVLLLNDDTVVQPGALDVLVRYLDEHPFVALAAPRVVDRAGRTQPSAWRQPTPILDVITAVSLGTRPRPLSDGAGPREVGWALGCALFARRSSLLAVGGFDESYFMYCEEIDLARRLMETGLRTHWLPAATVVHEGQVSTGGHASRARAVEMARSRRWFWQRHYSPPGRILAKIALSFEFVLLAVASIVRGREWRPFLIQALESWVDTARPGLREQAARWNAHADASGRPGGPLAAPSEANKERVPDLLGHDSQQ